MSPVICAASTVSCHLAPTVSLGHGITLNIAVVVFAGPDEAALRLHGVGYHVVNETVFVPDTGRLELRAVLPAEGRGG